MPDFLVTVTRTREETCEFTVKAKDEEAAQTKAENATQGKGWADKQEWQLETDDFEVTDVSEE